MSLYLFNLSLIRRKGKKKRRLKIKQYKNKNLINLYYSFYKIVFETLKTVVLRRLLYSSMFLSNSKHFNKFYLNYFFSFRQHSNIILNIMSTLFIFRKIFLFILNIFQQGGYFLLCNFESKLFLFDYEEYLKLIFSLNQSFVIGKTFGGLLTNKKRIANKIQRTKYKFNELEMSLPVEFKKDLKENIFYCERMMYNKYFRKNYFTNNNLPSCLIFLDLHSFLYSEAVILKMPIIGIVNTSSLFNSITYPLFINNKGLLSLFLFFIFLNKIFIFGFFIEILSYKANLLFNYKQKSFLQWVNTFKKHNTKYFMDKFIDFRTSKKSRQMRHNLQFYKYFNNKKQFFSLDNTLVQLRYNFIYRYTKYFNFYKIYNFSLFLSNYFYYKFLLFSITQTAVKKTKWNSLLNIPFFMDLNLKKNFVFNNRKKNFYTFFLRSPTIKKVFLRKRRRKTVRIFNHKLRIPFFKYF